MRAHSNSLLYSASDLVNFLGCPHSTVLDLRQLTDPVALPEPDEPDLLLQGRGLAHERAYLASLQAEGRSIALIDPTRTLAERTARTREAMAAGADVIYQGALFHRHWHGFSDFLLRVDGEPSRLGPFSYEVADTKLARTARPKHVVQLCVYSALVAREQEVLPRAMRVVLGTGGEAVFRVSDFLHYHDVARGRFEAFAGLPPEGSAGEPCGHCEHCRWDERCGQEWDAAYHLSLVAGLTRSQAKKLRAAGINTLVALADLPEAARIPKLAAETLDRLRAQARLQAAQRADGRHRHELLPFVPDRGFARLPPPDPGDLYFDMEGDPLHEGGSLEYLFGFVHREAGGEVRFTPFWGHDPAQEKRAFEEAVDFITARLAAHPGAHVYHYAAYEETALKRLAMFHGTREAEVDRLLRARALVDLYKVVREALRVSEPAYSIKNLEAF